MNRVEEQNAIFPKGVPPDVIVEAIKNPADFNKRIQRYTSAKHDARAEQEKNEGLLDQVRKQVAKVTGERRRIDDERAKLETDRNEWEARVAEQERKLAEARQEIAAAREQLKRDQAELARARASLRDRADRDAQHAEQIALRLRRQEDAVAKEIETQRRAQAVFEAQRGRLRDIEATIKAYFADEG